MSNASVRKYWVDTMLKISDPVIRNFAAETFFANMPEKGLEPWRCKKFAGLEALGRTFVGLAPWLNAPDTCPEEAALQQEYAALCRKALVNATNPASCDYVNFSDDFQPIVDAAFLCHALLRAPQQLWHPLSDSEKTQVMDALRLTRTRKPAFCNWLLFSAMIETFLRYAGQPDWDPMRVDFAIKQHFQWYLGDGMFADGPQFHHDYYNSFVIQPMLWDIQRLAGDAYPDWSAKKDALQKIICRYAALLERQIAPDGTFPVTGRSLAYRFGAFQALAQVAMDEMLPAEILPAQVRCALTKVIEKVMSAPDMFDENGWLNIGLYGNQPHIAEPYITTGSSYLCTAVFLPLGLSPKASFWADPDAPWTSIRVWHNSEDLPADHAMTL